MMGTRKSRNRGKQEMAINPSIGQKLIRSVSDDADFSVSLQSPEEKDQEIAQQLWEEKRMKSL